MDQCLGGTNLRIPPADLIGRAADTLVHPDDLDYALGALVEVNRSEGSHMPAQIRFIDANGDSRLIEVVAHTHHHIVVSLRDISRRDVLPKKRRELEQLVQRLSNQATSAPRGGLERGRDRWARRPRLFPRRRRGHLFIGRPRSPRGASRT